MYCNKIWLMYDVWFILNIFQKYVMFLRSGDRTPVFVKTYHIFLWQNNAYFVLFPVIIFDFIISGDPDAESASAILQ